jgi:hypothetical protein
VKACIINGAGLFRFNLELLSLSKELSRSVMSEKKLTSRSVKRPRKKATPKKKLGTSKTSRSAEEIRKETFGHYTPIWMVTSRSVSDEDKEEYNPK